jgi:hypothetical protein
MGASNHQRTVKRWVDPNSPEATAAPAPPVYERTHYIKPIHVAMPQVAHSNGSANSSSDLNGKLLRKSHGSAVIAQTKAVSTYADYAKGSPTKESSSSAVKTQVAGNIIHASGRRTSYNESPKTF